MPNQEEELKLVVTLVDNASAGLDKISEKLAPTPATDLDDLERERRNRLEAR